MVWGAPKPVRKFTPGVVPVSGHLYAFPTTGPRGRGGGSSFGSTIGRPTLMVIPVPKPDKTHPCRAPSRNPVFPPDSRGFGAPANGFSDLMHGGFDQKKKSQVDRSPPALALLGPTGACQPTHLGASKVGGKIPNGCGAHRFNQKSGCTHRDRAVGGGTSPQTPFGQACPRRIDQFHYHATLHDLPRPRIRNPRIK